MGVKIKDIISQFNILKPNQFDDALKLKWLSDFDGMVYNTVLKTHEGKVSEWKPYTNDEEILLIEDPYSEVYISLLTYKVDYFNQEYDKYNYSALMFASQLEAYQNYYNRTHLPLQNNKINGVY